MSMFGAMFGPRPERVAAELVRVCRPGGRIAMAKWTPDSFVANDEQTVRQRFGKYASEIGTARQAVDFDFALDPAGVVQFFRQYFGPTQVAFAKLPVDAQAAYAADLESLWREHNTAAEGHTAVRADYLEVIATRV
jgi:SAM-dependent methyltransferase